MIKLRDNCVGFKPKTRQTENGILLGQIRIATSLFLKVQASRKHCIRGKEWRSHCWWPAPKIYLFSNAFPAPDYHRQLDKHPFLCSSVATQARDWNANIGLIDPPASIQYIGCAANSLTLVSFSSITHLQEVFLLTFLHLSGDILERREITFEND